MWKLVIFESFSLGVVDAFFVCWWFSLHGWLWLWYKELMHIFYRIMFIRCLKCIITIHNIHEIFFYVNVDAFIVLIFQFIVRHDHDLYLLFVLLMHLLCSFFSWSITIMMFISFFYVVIDALLVLIVTIESFFLLLLVHLVHINLTFSLSPFPCTSS